MGSPTPPPRVPSADRPAETVAPSVFDYDVMPAAMRVDVRRVVTHANDLYLRAAEHRLDDRPWVAEPLETEARAEVHSMSKKVAMAFAAAARDARQKAAKAKETARTEGEALARLAESQVAPRHGGGDPA